MPCFDTSDFPDDSPEESLFARAQGGDQDAWKALFDECFPKVRRVISRRIGRAGKLRRYVDSTDIVSDVFGELAQKASRFRFDSVDAVRGFLLDAAHKRVVDEHRRHTTLKRDSGRDQPIDGEADAESDAGKLFSDEPTPSQHAVAQETDELLRAVTDDAEGRLVIDLRREHYNNEEISAQMGWPLRKVQRFLAKLRPIFLN